MKARIIGAALLVAVLAVAATTATGANKRSAASITVWLQVDAQSGWPGVVAAANAAFQKQHPGVTVNVQYQNWGTHLGKFDATLAGGNTPDVIEMGNTEMTKYMAAGAFQDLTSAKSSVRQLEQLARGPGRLGPVQRQALRRARTTRAPAWSRTAPTSSRQAGDHESTPKSLAQFTADASKLNKKFGKKGYSPVYIAGTDWYVAMSFVYDFGGKIAAQVSGKWKGLLESPKSIAGLTAYKNFYAAASKASKTTDENRPTPYSVYADGNAGSIVGPGWFTLLRRRQVQELDRAVRDAEPRGRQVDAGLPRRLRPGRADRRQQAAGQPTGSPRSRARRPRRPSRRPATSRTRPTSSTSRRSASGRPCAAGSSRLRRTGSTSRTGISSARC